MYIFLTKTICVDGLVRYLHSAVNAVTMRKALKDGDCPHKSLNPQTLPLLTKQEIMMMISKESI